MLHSYSKAVGISWAAASVLGVGGSVSQSLLGLQCSGCLALEVPPNAIFLIWGEPRNGPPECSGIIPEVQGTLWRTWAWHVPP